MNSVLVRTTEGYNPIKTLDLINLKDANIEIPNQRRMNKEISFELLWWKANTMISMIDIL